MEKRGYIRRGLTSCIPALTRQSRQSGQCVSATGAVSGKGEGYPAVEHVHRKNGCGVVAAAKHKQQGVPQTRSASEVEIEDKEIAAALCAEFDALAERRQQHRDVGELARHGEHQLDRGEEQVVWTPARPKETVSVRQ
jgi:hypothetical protein